MRKTAKAGMYKALGLAILVGAGAAELAGQTSTATQQPAAASTAAQSSGDGSFSKDQLEQLVAPIALYSDALLAQMLMAATYPIEIVEAERFMTANPGLKDAALDEKLKEQDWDASVKSLLKAPEVLTKMSQNLDWTQDLGDAFLGQKTELMDTIQTLRGKASESGNLKTTEQQVVTVQQDKIIVIESPSPEVVYVPSYSPTVVYGPSYPPPPSYYYPSMYPYYPPGAGLVTFGVGMAMGAAIWGGCNWGWGGGDVDIDVNRQNNFNRNTNINGGNRANTTGGRQSFQHDASHRKGAGYQNSKVAGQYGAKGGSSRVGSEQARGRSGSGTGGTREARAPREGGGQGTARDRSASGDRAGAGGDRAGAGGDRAGAGGDRAGAGGERAGTADRAAAGGDRGGGQRASASDRSGSGGQRSQGASSRSGSGSGSGSRSSSAYSGSSKPNTARASSSRGSSSMGSRSYGGGGGSRGGGSRGGGGGRRW